MCQMLPGGVRMAVMRFAELTASYGMHTTLRRMG
jgi:hypothetical protein